jgi:hypothetical protein
VVFVMLATVFVGLSALLAWSYPLRAGRLCTLDGAKWETVVDGLPPTERIGRLRQQAPAGSWEADLATALAAAGDDRARALALNDALATAEHELDAQQHRPRAALWLALASSAACAIAGFLSGARLTLLYIVPIIACGAALCLQAARTGRRRSAAQRANIDALVAAVAGEIATLDLDLPERRRMRWRRKR